MKTSTLFGHEMLGFMGEHARKILIEQKASGLDTIYHLFLPQPPHLVIPCPWRNDAEKEGYLSVLRALARTKGAVAFASVAEVWMASYDVGEIAPGGPYPRPSQSDRKVEAVMATYHDGVDTLSRRWLIERGSDGYVSDLVEQPSFDGSFGGRMIDDILP